ncbi:MAG TPA: hypothetical protein VG621_03330 [Candidatus Paceibacterota bacterium]|nr:hypothetical protein [Candidatus Paceibacterota bacterium]
MYESFGAAEQPKKSRKEVIDALKANGLEDPEAREALGAFIEQSRREVEKITTKKEHYRASIQCSIDNATLFHEAGYVQEAYDDLLDTREIAFQAGETDLIEKIESLLRSYKSQLDGKGPDSF